VRERRIDPWRHRGSDVEAARRVLAARPDVLADRIGLLGWSHGGSTVLAAVDVKARHVASDGGDFTVAIAFYPGCLVPSRRGNWDARVETLILMGEDDDWTPPGPCVAMVDRLSAPARVSIRLYPGAVHGFDGEGTRVITRTGLITPSGSAKVGPHPEARADAIGRTLELLKARLAN
jgi:dienelactone hydrolase